MSDQPAQFPEIVAVVGEATLIKWSFDTYELLNRGSDADRKEILKWSRVHLKGAQVLVSHHAQTGRGSDPEDPWHSR